MSIDSLILIGAGGHAKVVVDALTLRNRQNTTTINVTDQDPERVGKTILGHVVEAWPDDQEWAGKRFHLAIGDAASRARLWKKLVDIGASGTSIQHPSSSVAATAQIGRGSFTAARAVIAPDAKIGVSVIVNHGAVVDHDCIVGSYSHIAPNATLGGGSSLGDGVLVGAGATILPGVRIGENAVIAAGATIVRDVAEGETVIFSLVRKNKRL